MVAGLVLRVAAIVFAVLTVFSTAILTVQMIFALNDGSMPSKMFWLPWVTILTGTTTATLIMRMILAN